MSNFTIIYRSNKKTNLENLLKQLGNENIEAVFNNSKCIYTFKEKVTTKEKELEELVEKTPLDIFLEKYKITSYSKYTSKSILLKKSYLTKVTQGDKIINSNELERPLYYNVSLQGWISSLKNENILKEKILKPLTSSNNLNIQKRNFSKSKVNNEKKSLTYIELSGYSFSNYKNCLLLKYNGPNKLNGKDYPYFHGGYWNQTLGGWIFKRSKKNYLLNNGAVHTSSSNTKSKNVSKNIKKTSKTVYNFPLEGYKLKFYKKGILMTLNTNHNMPKNYKYFHGGYWNDTLNGWIFKKSYKDALESRGASF
tara:strand:- start:2445 stop:3371 length:927 start_codon:yes stop_codon:yes gene_type:complete